MFVFDTDEKWPAPVYRDVDELRDLLDSYDLKGKRLKEVYITGYCYYCDEIEDYEYIRRVVSIDEPAVLVFDDGMRLELLTDAYNSPRVSVNSIAENAVLSDYCNIDGDVVFSPVLNRTLEKVEITTTDVQGDPPGYFCVVDKDRSEYIDEIRFMFDGGYEIIFSTFIDYCEVVLDCKGEKLYMSNDEFRKAMIVREASV